MQENEYKVWNLLDADDLKDAARHVQEQMDQARRDLDLAAQADRALEEIQRLLVKMKDLARQALEPEADRKRLENQFASYRMRIDLVAAHARSALSPQEAARLEMLLASLDKTLP